MGDLRSDEPTRTGWPRPRSCNSRGSATRRKRFVELIAQLREVLNLVAANPAALGLLDAKARKLATQARHCRPVAEFDERDIRLVREIADGLKDAAARYVAADYRGAHGAMEQVAAAAFGLQERWG